MKQRINYKGVFFVGIIGILSLGMLDTTDWFPKFVLKGSFDKQENPHINIYTWLSGEYQIKQEKYLSENFGFRDIIIRFNNQMNYSLFNTTTAKKVIIGKEKYLYEEDYILSYLGRNLIDSNQLEKKVLEIKKVQDTLNKLGIDLLVIIAADKASFYPEFIPDTYLDSNKTTNNYDIFSKNLIRFKVNHINFSSWFNSMKMTSKYELFPKCGIHWSKYGEVIAADSIIKYIENKRNIKLPELQVDTIIYSNRMRDTDDDIEKSMNLLFDIKDLRMAYPQFEFIKDKPWDSVSVLTIADSYFWGLYNIGLSREVFNRGEFWYYNNQIYSDNTKEMKYVKDIVDFQKEIEKNDMIILLATESNLNWFPFGFINSAVYTYFNENYISPRDKARIDYYIQKIMLDSNWLSFITEQSKDLNITLEKGIRLNAEYMVKEEKQKK